MNHRIALLAGLALLLGTGGALAHGGGHSGGSRGGSPGGARVAGTMHVGSVAGVRSPVFAGRPPVFAGRPPVLVGRPPIFVAPPFPRPHHHGGGGGAVIVAAPFFYGYPYTPYPYYPPAYPAPVYENPPTYIEQGADIHYYCPDSRGYYPDVPTCASPWVQVLPDGSVVSP